jgi:hypothetical protein
VLFCGKLSLTVKTSWRTQFQAQNIGCGIERAFLFASGLGLGQSGQTTSLLSYDKLPDWSGVWQMQGGTVFDRATQTGQGGSASMGVREHPPGLNILNRFRPSNPNTVLSGSRAERPNSRWCVSNPLPPSAALPLTEGENKALMLRA